MIFGKSSMSPEAMTAEGKTKVAWGSHRESDLGVVKHAAQLHLIRQS